MKQIFRTNYGIKTIEVPKPTLGDNELLVSIHASVISTGTETAGMHKGETTLSEILSEKKLLFDKVLNSISKNGLKSTIEAIKEKLDPSEQSQIFQPIGYSNSGLVVSKGRLVHGFNVGDRIACAGSGIAAHAEFSVIPVNLAVKLPDGLDFVTASFTTIGAIAMQGIRRANITFGETVIITGLGLLGLIAVQIAKAWGLVVIGIDLDYSRIERAKELGADMCIQADDPDLVKKVKDFTKGNGADAVIIYAATKSSKPANQGLEACRRKGRVVVVGAIGMELQREAMYAKELDFVMSTSYGAGRYDDLYELKGIDYPIGYVRWTENRNMMEFVRLLATGMVKVDSLISNSFTIDQSEKAYRSLVENPGKNIASIFLYQHEDVTINATKKIDYPKKRQREKIGVGIIGAGSFLKRTHIENIVALHREYELIAIANKTPGSAKLVGEKYKTKYTTTNYLDLLNDPNIDLIIIGTRHNLHAKQVIDSINSGKHVLVEKPLAMTQEELLLIEKTIGDRSDQIATVGFNRRYSPFIQKTKKILEKISAPSVICYRVNAGYFPPDIWIQNLEVGGGRIIGEACHFLDLICYLADSKLTKIGVIHIPVGMVIKSEDNVIVTMSFENGSIGVLTYTSIGGKEMEKERIEIFSGSCSLVISDFVQLITYNCNEKSIKLKVPDKGHKILIRELAKKINGEPSLIPPFENDIDTTRITLEVVDMIHHRL